MLKKIVVAVAVIVLVFVVIVAMQRSEFRIVRSATISAPPSVLFAHVNDFHRWETWSPWEKLDPAMTRSYEGASSGVGAIYAWSGNEEVGKGRMTITESREDELVRITLEFLEPFAATNTTEFMFTPEGGQTVVTWSMFGEHGFVGKLFSVFMDMDAMVGPDFEKGLGQMKAIAESANQP